MRACWQACGSATTTPSPPASSITGCGTETATATTPGYALGCWLRENADQVWLFTTAFEVEWTSNSAERAVKGPKRHQAVSGYWHTQQTLGRWCRIRSYLDSAANHGLTALDATTSALAGKPWLPATLPAIQIAA